MRKGILLVFALASLLHSGAFAQKRCGLQAVDSFMTHGDAVKMQQIHEQRVQFLKNTQTSVNAAAKTTGVSSIPVVFHLILTQTQYNQIGGSSGINKRIDSQIVVLNRDFNAQNGDSVSIPTAFKPYYGKAGIHFGLAQKKPDGNATVGYELLVLPAGADSTFGIYGGIKGSGIVCSDAKYTSSGKGFDAWDNTKYINIWIVNIGGNSGIIGITLSQQTSVIYQTPSVEEGLVITYGAFGTRSSASDYFISGIDKGRTITHEMGHYFEMIHVWGDDNGACPGQSGYADDGIADTPPQGDANYGCPTYPKISCSGQAHGDMFMDYMDYVDDACMMMFTVDQASLMNSMIQPGGESYSLTQNPGLLAVNNVVAEQGNFTIAPNPSTGIVNIAFTKYADQLQSIEVLNLMGQSVRHIDANNSGIYSIDLSANSGGIYFVQCKFADGAVTQKIVLQ